MLWLGRSRLLLLGLLGWLTKRCCLGLLRLPKRGLLAWRGTELTLGPLLLLLLCLLRLLSLHRLLRLLLLRRTNLLCSLRVGGRNAVLGLDGSSGLGWSLRSLGLHRRDGRGRRNPSHLAVRLLGRASRLRGLRL